jgi:DNA-binding CsgD family transcriptional regulator
MSGTFRGKTLWPLVLYGGLGGVLIALLRVVQYQFLVVEHSVEIYGALIAALFAGLGIWLGLTITRKKSDPEVIVREVHVPVEVPAGGPFSVNEVKVRELGLTPRELEILGLIAEGLSTREIAEKAFVSESTVKTHASRLFDKLGAKRRTQAVQIGKSAGLIP